MMGGGIVADEMRAVQRALVLSGGGARGAFQAGVIRYLDEIGWRPDLVCGTSVGAVNAVAMGCGMPVHQLIALWRDMTRRRVYLRRPRRLLAHLFGRRPFAATNDTGPMRALLSRHLDIAALRRSPMEIVISAVNMATGETAWFDQSQIGVDHVAASAAIPILFPWQTIDGLPHWDGGVMNNTPLAPALARNARQIIVVLLSPVGAAVQPLPASLHRMAELAFEQLLIASYRATLTAWQVCKPGTAAERPQIHTVAPTRMLGFRSYLNFSAAQARRLVCEGYEAARRQLAHLEQPAPPATR